MQEKLYNNDSNLENGKFGDTEYFLKELKQNIIKENDIESNEKKYLVYFKGEK